MTLGAGAAAGALRGARLAPKMGSRIWVVVVLASFLSCHALKRPCSGPWEGRCLLSQGLGALTPLVLWGWKEPACRMPSSRSIFMTDSHWGRCYLAEKEQQGDALSGKGAEVGGSQVKGMDLWVAAEHAGWAKGSAPPSSAPLTWEERHAQRGQHKVALQPTRSIPAQSPH